MYITASRAFTLKLPVALLAKRLQTHSLLLCPWLPRGWKIGLCCWRYHALQKQNSETPEPEPTWMPSLWRLTFMVAEGAMQASNGERQPTVPPSYHASELHQRLAWHDNPEIAVIEHTPWRYQMLSNCTAIPGTGNLLAYSVLVKSWLLDENLQLPID